MFHGTKEASQIKAESFENTFLLENDAFHEKNEKAAFFDIFSIAFKIDKISYFRVLDNSDNNDSLSFYFILVWEVTTAKICIGYRCHACVIGDGVFTDADQISSENISRNY